MEKRIKEHEDNESKRNMFMVVACKIALCDEKILIKILTCNDGLAVPIILTNSDSIMCHDHSI